MPEYKDYLCGRGPRRKYAVDNTSTSAGKVALARPATLRPLRRDDKCRAGTGILQMPAEGRIIAIAAISKDSDPILNGAKISHI
jgi:hypothetical protein